MDVIGCDIGGTFTDFVLLDGSSGELIVEKLLTTPEDPSKGVLAGLARLQAQRPEYLARAGRFIHGTTLVANAVIERQGAKTALLTTCGFRDVLEMRRQKRVDFYEYRVDPPAPLVPRRYRYEVDERVLADGRIYQPLDEEGVRAIGGELVAAGIESVAVSLIHAYRNPIHEQAVRRLLDEVAPELFVSVSSEVLPEIREFERTSTTVINAYVQPRLARYISSLEAGLHEMGFAGNFLLMLSAGGMAAASVARAFPVRLAESGAAAGALAGRALGQLIGTREVLSFDMGGTTAKACLIRDGVLPTTDELEVARTFRHARGSGLPASMPSVDLMEIGAGGGSIARVNAMGLLQIGPQSAGARPGPACYGRGGAEPTVTDADLVLGYLNPDYFLGGELKLDVEAARRAIAERLAVPLGLDPVLAAWGVHDLVNEQMASEVRAHVAERGGEVRRATLVAFGGAGPVHADGLARKLRVPRLLVPLRAGVAPTLGFLVAPISFDVVRSLKVPLASVQQGEVDALFASMAAEAESMMRQAAPSAEVELSRSVDMCYLRQGYGLAIPLPDLTFERFRAGELVDRFSEAYRQRYGYAYADQTLELLGLRLRASTKTGTLSLRRLPACGQSAAAALKGRRPAFSGLDRRFVEHAVYERQALAVSALVLGPAIVEERESTLVIGRGAQATVDDYGNLLVEVPVGGRPPDGVGAAR